MTGIPETSHDGRDVKSCFRATIATSTGTRFCLVSAYSFDGAVRQAVRRELAEHPRYGRLTVGATVSVELMQGTAYPVGTAATFRHDGQTFRLAAFNPAPSPFTVVAEWNGDPRD